MIAAKLSGTPEGFQEFNKDRISKTKKKIDEFLKSFYTVDSAGVGKTSGFLIGGLKNSVNFLSEHSVGYRYPKYYTLNGASPLTTQQILESTDGGFSIINQAHKEIKRSANPNLLAFYLCIELIYLYADLERASEKNGHSYDNKLFHFKRFLGSLLNHDASALEQLPAKSEGLYHRHFLRLKESVDSILNSVAAEHRWLITDVALNIFFKCYLNPCVAERKPHSLDPDFYTFYGRMTLSKNASSNYVALASSIDAVFELAYRKNPERYFIYHDPNQAEPATYSPPQIPLVIERVLEAPYESPKLTPRNSEDSDSWSVSSTNSSPEVSKKPGSSTAGIAQGLNSYVRDSVREGSVAAVGSSPVVEPPVMAVAVLMAEPATTKELKAGAFETPPRGNSARSGSGNIQVHLRRFFTWANPKGLSNIKMPAPSAPPMEQNSVKAMPYGKLY